MVLWFAGTHTHLAGNSLAEVMGNSADVASYLVPPENTPFGQWVAAHTSPKPRWIWGEQTLYVGLVTLVLGLLGTWVWTRCRDRLTAAVLVAGGIAVAVAPAGQRHPCGGCGGRPWESYVVGFPGGTPPREPIPAVYTRLASLPPGPVLSLPTYRFAPDNFHEADYLLFSTAHWLPIVNGFGRHEPPGHKELMEILSRFPAPDALARLRQIGVRDVVLHPARASELARTAGEAEQVPGIRLVAHDGDDFLFEVGPAS